MNNHPPKADTLCRCRVCQSVVRVSYAQCLRLGSWPTCHGEVMEPITVHANIAAEFEQAILPCFYMTADALRVKLRGEENERQEGDH